MFRDGKKSLQSGINDTSSGNKENARRHLDHVLNTSNDHDVLAETWFKISELIDDQIEKRQALKNCLAYNLHHVRAHKALAILDGKLKADEIIDPDQLLPAPKGPHAVEAERFMCPKCGGRMCFSPDGQSLVCEYCARNQKLTAQPGGIDEKDFIVAMATARGHRNPLNQQVVHCEGCGCEFILPPNQISSTCVYCDSPYVVHWETDQELLAPDGIIPHAFNQKYAIQFLAKWVAANQIKPEKKVEIPRGLYLPLWTFNLRGELNYIGEIVEDRPPFEENTPFFEFIHPLIDLLQNIQMNGSYPEFIHAQNSRMSGSYPIYENAVPIPASRKLFPFIQELAPTFDCKNLQPYDPRYLANWPAEVYDISLAEASLEARAQIVERYKWIKSIDDLPIHPTSLSSAKMVVESFHLNLLPVWMTEIFFDGCSSPVLINGQNGSLASRLGVFQPILSRK
jgi:hypothetical protein